MSRKDRLGLSAGETPTLQDWVIYLLEVPKLDLPLNENFLLKEKADWLYRFTNR